MRAKILLPVLLLALVAALVAFDLERRASQAELKRASDQLQDLQKNTPEQNQRRAVDILALVGKHLQLDASEKPTVAAIIDVEKLRAKSAFYKKAKNGNYLIITSSRAILYDPGSDVIVDIAPVQIESGSSSQNVAR